jgi:hypothetical protein
MTLRWRIEAVHPPQPVQFLLPLLRLRLLLLAEPLHPLKSAVLTALELALLVLLA